jgi:hypothetical protein
LTTSTQLNGSSTGEIFKVQWPIFCNQGPGNVRIYNEDRSIDFEAPQHWFTGDLKTFLQTKLKAYVRAFINTDRKFQITEVLDERIWPDW